MLVAGIIQRQNLGTADGELDRVVKIKSGWNFNNWRALINNYLVFNHYSLTEKSSP